MPKKRKKSSPDCVWYKPAKSRAKQATKMATSNSQVNNVVTQPIGPQISQTQPLTPQQFMMPSPFQFPQYMTSGNSPSHTDSVLQTLLHKIENIESKMGQLSEIRSSVNKITQRLDSMDKRICEIEHSQKHISDQYDSVTTNVTKNADGVKESKSDIKRLQNEIEDLKKANTVLKDDNIDLKCRSMRDNLVFFGIPEVSSGSDQIWDTPLAPDLSTDNPTSAPNSTPEGMETSTPAATASQSTFRQRNPNLQEDCEEKVHVFLTKVLNIQDSRSKVKIDRAHRMNTSTPNRSRPMVAKFCDTKSKMVVKNALRDVNLRGTGYNVTEQYPPEVQQKRRELIPIMVQARRDGKLATLVRDKLYINRQEYVLPKAN